MDKDDFDLNIDLPTSSSIKFLKKIFYILNIFECKIISGKIKKYYFRLRIFLLFKFMNNKLINDFKIGENKLSIF